MSAHMVESHGKAVAQVGAQKLWVWSWLDRASSWKGSKMICQCVFLCVYTKEYSCVSISAWWGWSCVFLFILEKIHGLIEVF